MAAQVVHAQPVPGATYYPQAVPNVIYVSCCCVTVGVAEFSLVWETATY